MGCPDFNPDVCDLFAGFLSSFCVGLSFFCFCLGVTFWKYTLQIFKALVCAAILSMVRILPPLLSMGVFDTDFYGGYPLFRNIADANDL